MYFLHIYIFAHLRPPCSAAQAQHGPGHKSCTLFSLALEPITPPRGANAILQLAAEDSPFFLGSEHNDALTLTR